jgi:tRNA pseudouridine38-40 synthase
VVDGGRRERAARSSQHAWCLRLEYDGGRYAGFQVQPRARTIAGELGAALRAVVGGPVRLAAAGRTDAGVHAEGQVVSFLTARRLDARALREAVNDRLPADINVLEAAEVEPGFHARHRAVARTYRYQVSTRRDAFRKRFVWWVRSGLDLARLEAEAAAVAGSHDFASFTDAADEETVVRVIAAAWSRDGDLLLFRIGAERFLYRMVRRLVGAMVEVGLGREAPGLVGRLVAEPRPGAAAAWTAPPSGLFLERVDYPQRTALPTRARRG